MEEKKGFKGFILKIKAYYDYAKLKRYDTMAGTLSFFFLLSFIPLLYLCLSLYIKIGTWISGILEVATPIPEVIEQYVSFDVSMAASIFFILTTIYSASKFFMQLKKTGEILYGVTKPRAGIKSIVLCCIFVIFMMLVVSSGLLGIALSRQYLTEAWQNFLVQILVYLLIAIMIFIFVCVVNKLGCQIRKIKIKRLMPGILFSFVFAVLLCSLFGIYLGFTSYNTLYGYFTTVIIAAVFVFYLMQGMVIGLVINEKKLHDEFIDDGEDDGTSKIINGVLTKIKKKDKKKEDTPEEEN